MTQNPCACIEENHSHKGTCGSEGFSHSIEHANEWRCRECYQHFVNAKEDVKAFQSALMQVAMQAPEKLQKARNLVADVIGGGK